MRRSYLADMMVSSEMSLRPGCGNFLRAMREEGVPVCVASAGFSDVISTFLSSEGVDTDETSPLFRVSANRMVFDDDAAESLLAGFSNVQGSPWHGANKAQTYQREKNYFDAHLRNGRDYFVVLGDKPGDAAVIEGLPSDHIRTVLSIGFFSSGDDSRYSLADYAAVYDLVLPACAAGFAELQQLLLAKEGAELSSACRAMVGDKGQTEVDGIVGVSPP